MDIIEARNLKKSFGPVTAVDDVSLCVKKGEIFGFLGQNGAGKTTTIRMLTGVLIPDAGIVRICGVDILRDPLEAKMHMGIIPENGTVYADLTAEKNILWTAKCYGMDRRSREEKAKEILARLGLESRKDDLVRTFSKGMRQRISIACAIVHSPPVLFLDEPTTGLDVLSRRLVIDTVRHMNREGSTVLITTHNLEEANALCSRVSVIHRGKIIGTDSPEKIRKQFDTAGYIEVSFDRSVQGSMLVTGSISRAEPHGDKWRVYSDDTDWAIKALTRVAEQNNLKILSVATSTPSLEQAFIEMTEEA
ncbi:MULTISPECIES: ABC transporter ATP-binding protein [unclassified Methanoregula]|uniref:ABC transporter ATP-binding protein n=1 Tax=unclassified Methanoregula TaxID=2649730 RepID=UPI0009CBF89D|nr:MULTISPECIES: ABC transporter ATP-binding protein [unclassified Methanoregula]OPX64367.1 MAG: Trehalose/maltose import ATP-binding protein MalK [Methanoregula sp. PtaB.Bin085]OPY34963.1 MAG: Trehalose/maltose import ATP-binding protein MalK [Methanoregula sp. PtaU1.Bin006]